MVKFSSDYDALVGSIYDCAANPELWPETLGQVRDSVGAAYALVGLIDKSAIYPGGRTTWIRRNSAWDEEWLAKLERMMHLMPDAGGLQAPLDTAWTQLSMMPEEAFHQTDFYKSWVQPQGLRDTINIPYLHRADMVGMWNLPSFSKRQPYSADDMRLCESLTPHIRRAILINDLTDKGRLALTLYRQVLDTLSVAVFVVGLGQRLVFTNAAGDKMLSQGEYLNLVGGALQARREAGQATAFEAAIARALKGDMAVGISGIGVPLIGYDGDRVAAYVLPIAGKDVRGALGPGHCAVFVARRGQQQPMAVEILRTVHDLTTAEANIALLIAKGDGPQTIADALGISVNTVRSHLKHCFAKTGTPDQTALSGLINGLLPPVK